MNDTEKMNHITKMITENAKNQQNHINRIPYELLNEYPYNTSVFSKETQAFEYISFTEFKNEDELEFCCEKLMKYVSIVKDWSGKIGKFCIVEKDTIIPIDYCPFCGEKIEYISVE